ncbi:MAG: PQQ-like beta-propeller repeat protein [Planctomycetes bacterium]|nr:PQQ-like beta-propeller repeat protein [Planctomycetota bacterium]
MVLATAALTSWLLANPSVPVEPRVPASTVDESPAETKAGAASSRLIPGSGTPSSHPGAWTCFRGEERDGLGHDTVRLSRQWPADGPRERWRLDAGEGYAGAAVRAGRVYLHDYDQATQVEAIRCLSFDDGREIWRFAYPNVIKRNHGMSRTVPAVGEKHLVAFGPKCHVTCLDPATGALRWQLDLVRDFGSKVPPWYAGQCPLLEDGRVILAPCGDDLLIAVNADDGKVLWRTPNRLAWKMTHASVVPMALAGRRTYLYAGSGGIACVDAAGGTLLWTTDLWKISIATIATPVPAGDGRIFVAGGYNAGAAMLQVEPDGAGYGVREAWRLAPEVFGATQQTPILFENHLYGIRPDGELACLDLDGKLRWTSGPQHRFGLGPLLIAGGLLYAMNDDGLLSMCEAVPDAFRLLAQAKVLYGHDAWGPMALAGGRLIARDLTQLVCLDVAEKP